MARTVCHCFARRGHPYGRPFKARPSAICTVCGDDPVSNNGSRVQFDLAHGWPYLLTEDPRPFNLTTRERVYG